MAENNSFALTLVRVGPFLPYIEVAAYEYRGVGLPEVGETITVSRIAGRDGATPDETAPSRGRECETATQGH